MAPNPSDGPGGAGHDGKSGITPFSRTLARHGLRLTRVDTATLQVNVGLVCNQACKHCHLEAGPDRTELMNREVMDEVVRLAGTGAFQVVDVTGGAPEMHPDIGGFVERLAKTGVKLFFRSNLTALADRPELMETLCAHKVVVITSFPSLNQAQAEGLRGRGVFKKSVEALQKLCDLGYGKEESGLELNLVVNPSGAFLSPSQDAMEKRFKKTLLDKWGIRFNHLYSFANVPLGRFKKWLVASGNYGAYMKKLSAAFNPCALDGVMCRSLVSVSWDGFMYDCDFNQAADIGMGNQRVHVSDISGPPESGSPIAVSDHCFTCTAGAGFT